MKMPVAVEASGADQIACLIGVEACGSAHYWARKLLAMGHHREATGRGDPCTQKKAASTAAENITFATNIIAADD